MIQVLTKDGIDAKFPSDYVGYRSVSENKYVVYKSMNDPTTQWEFDLSKIDAVYEGGHRII